MGPVKQQAREGNAALGHALIDLYVDWCEECAAVHSTYERWRSAPKHDTEAAFAAYMAALDREERAGNVYAALVRRIAPRPS
jgi:urease accessory protein UreF